MLKAEGGGELGVEQEGGLVFERGRLNWLLGGRGNWLLSGVACIRQKLLRSHSWQSTATRAPYTLLYMLCSASPVDLISGQQHCCHPLDMAPNALPNYTIGQSVAGSKNGGLGDIPTQLLSIGVMAFHMTKCVVQTK